MTVRFAVSLVLLALLLIVPPVAMATDHCVGMGQMCDAPCGATAGVAVDPAVSSMPDLMTSLGLRPPPVLPVSFPLSADPPPKF